MILALTHNPRITTTPAPLATTMPISSAVLPSDRRPLNALALTGPLVAPIPATTDEVSSEYLTTVLRANNVIDAHLTVTIVHTRRIGFAIGFNSHCALLDLE